MKFFLGFLTSTILFLILIIGVWIYLDFPIDTNEETSPRTNQNFETQQTYQTDPSQAPVSDNNVDNTEITPSGLSEKDYNELDHNIAGTNNHDYAVKHGLTQEDK